MTVPLLDVLAHHAPIQSEIEEAALRVLRSGRFILGPEIDGFEKELAAAIGSADAVALSSGTDALLAVLMALGVGPGSEVVTTPFTFFATAGVVSRLGARPVFADIEPASFNLDPAKAEAAITPRTKAILPVHLFGQSVDLDRYEDLSKRKGIPVVEDSCQAVGARFKGRPVGSAGVASCLSFFPSKNLGCAGDGGAITTNDPEFGKKIRATRMHGETSRYHHLFVGGNFRMDALQAAILRVKLPHLPGWEAGRRKNADRYRSLFAEAGLAGGTVSIPEELPGAHHVYNQFVIRVPKRDELTAFLAKEGIGHAVYYPVPLHLQECFRDLGYAPGAFPEAEKACAEVLAIPIFSELAPGAQEEVVSAISRFYRG
jgi:dTDP-4-amino-4,6-dideoxygalactose transaminase